MDSVPYAIIMVGIGYSGSLLVSFSSYSFGRFEATEQKKNINILFYFTVNDIKIVILFVFCWDFNRSKF